MAHRRRPSQDCLPPNLYVVRLVPIFEAERAPRRTEPPINVTDDWPEFVPVSDREARIIEAFFADVLDELFGPIP